MKLEEVPEYDRNAYTETCRCGYKQTVYSQADNYAEYVTNVFVECRCGEVIKFVLPVN